MSQRDQIVRNRRVDASRAEVRAFRIPPSLCRCMQCIAMVLDLKMFILSRRHPTPHAADHK